MEIKQDTIDAMAASLHSITEQIESDLIVESSEYYELAADEIDIDGKRCQVVVKVVVSEDHHLENDTVFYKEKDEESEEE